MYNLMYGIMCYKDLQDQDNLVSIKMFLADITRNNNIYLVFI